MGLYLRLPHIAQMTEKFNIYRGGNSQSKFTMKSLSLSLSLFRTLGPGDGYGTNVSLSLHICFKKIVLDPKKYHMKTLLLIPFSMKLLLA